MTVQFVEEWFMQEKDEIQMEKTACVKTFMKWVAFSENYIQSWTARSFGGMNRCDF